jgi:hypothetical protein
VRYKIFRINHFIQGRSITSPLVVAPHPLSAFNGSTIEDNVLKIGVGFRFVPHLVKRVLSEPCCSITKIPPNLSSDRELIRCIVIHRIGPCSTTAGDSCKSITFETLQTRSTFRIVVTVSLAQLERYKWVPSDAFKLWVDAVIITTDSRSTAAGSMRQTVTFETLQTRSTLRVVVTVSVAQLEPFQMRPIRCF